MILHTFLALLSIFGYMNFLISRKFVNVFSAPLITISILIIIEYTFGVAGFLLYGYYSAIAFGLLLFAFDIYNRNLSRVPTKNDLIPLLICIMPFFVLIFSISKDFMFTTGDEFSFWAVSIRFIAPNDSLYTADSPIIFKAYPPAQQMLHYFVVKTIGWKEWAILASQGFFVLSCLLAAAGSVIKNKVVAGLSFIVAITVMYSCGYDLSNIYADPLLAAYFAAALAIAISCGEGREKLLSLILVVATLTLIKQVGLILSIFALIVYAVNLLLVNRNITLSIKNVASCLSVLFTIVVAYKTWATYVKSIGAASAITVPSYDDIFSQPLLNRLGITLVAFKNAIFNQAYAEPGFSHQSVSFAGIYLLLIIASLAAILIAKHSDRIRVGLTGLVLLGGIIAYNIFLLFCYLVIFTEYEGTRLASFHRYSYAFTLPVVLLYAFYFLNAAEIKKKHSGVIISAILLIVSISLSQNKLFDDIKEIRGNKDARALRLDVQSISNKIKEDANGGEARSYFISQNSTGFEKYIFNFEMMPYKSVWWCWSIGEKYFPDDVWTCNESLEKLTEGYQYIAVYNGDEKFWSLARKYLATGSNEHARAVYRISRESGKLVMTEVK